LSNSVFCLTYTVLSAAPQVLWIKLVELNLPSDVINIPGSMGIVNKNITD